MNQCGLAMGRSMGDHALAAVGVIATPELTSYTITPNDRWAVTPSPRNALSGECAWMSAAGSASLHWTRLP